MEQVIRRLEIGDLDIVAVKALIEHWLPEVKLKSKLLADDCRLIAALEAAQKALTADGEVDLDNIPY